MPGSVLQMPVEKLYAMSLSAGWGWGLGGMSLRDNKHSAPYPQLWRLAMCVMSYSVLSWQKAQQLPFQKVLHTILNVVNDLADSLGKHVDWMEISHDVSRFDWHFVRHASRNLLYKFFVFFSVLVHFALWLNRIAQDLLVPAGLSDFHSERPRFFRIKPVITFTVTIVVLLSVLLHFMDFLLSFCYVSCKWLLVCLVYCPSVFLSLSVLLT